jgi:cyanate permease
MMAHDAKTPFRWIVLVLLFINLFSAMAATQSIPPLFTEIGKQIPLTKTQMGSIMGVVTLASLFFAPIGGGISDRIGSRWALGISAIVVAVAGMLRATTGSALTLALCMFFIGAGLAVLGPNMPKALGMWFPRSELAAATGIAMAGAGLGSAVAMGTAASVLSPAVGGWRNGVVFIGILNLVVGILWLAFFRDRRTSEDAKEKPHVLDNLKNVLRVKDVWLLAVFCGFTMAGSITVVSLLPITLAERGVERPGETVSIMMVTIVVFNVLGGMLSDKVGRRKPFLVVSAVLFGMCMLSFASATGLSLIISLIVAGAAVGTIGPVLMALPVEIDKVGPMLTASAVGLIFMVGNSIGFVGPVVSGKLMDLSGVHWPAFVAMGVVLVLAAGCILPFKETGEKKKPRE